MIAVEAILAAKRAEIAALEGSRSLEREGRTRARYPFLAALERPGLSVIAEVKRSSPSTGPFGIEPRALLDAYLAAGIDAVSILSDPHFGMDRDEFRALAAEASIPVLRKDFILAPSQVRESEILGADAILLIASFLSREELESLGSHAKSCGLDVLYEVHCEEDLAKIPPCARIVGINNRDLAGGDYRTDLDLSATLMRALPPGVVKVAESGYDRPGQVPSGFDAVLVGGGLIREFKKRGDVADLVASLKAAMLAP